MSGPAGIFRSLAELVKALLNPGPLPCEGSVLPGWTTGPSTNTFTNTFFEIQFLKLLYSSCLRDHVLNEPSLLQTDPKYMLAIS